MWKRSGILMILVALIALTSSCIFDPDEETPKDPVIPDPWPALTEKEDVLYTLQRSYVERRIERYETILDDGFTFFLSDGDVNNGLPVQWDRDVEVNANRNLFSRSRVGSFPLVKSIDMDVQFESGVQWVPVIPASAPTETWYTTTAFYFFQITVEQEGQTEDLTYYPDANSKAQFTVRNVGTDDDPSWVLVEWRDLGAGT